MSDSDLDEHVDVSVVIPAHNSAATIGRQLNALARQETSVSWEVIVVSNNSTDHLNEAIAGYQQKFPVPICVVEANGKRGAANARNMGGLHANGDILAFCDADDEVLEGWIQAA
ncbi:glycosyltransferase family 2 protein [Neomicrococcus lactis]